MAKDPAFLFYSNDFLSGTFTMSDEQVGKYIRLLCIQHQKGLLSEKDMLKICKRYDEDIFSKFKQDKNGNFFNVRLKEEHEKRKAYSDSRRKNRMKPKKEGNEKTYDKHMENENENRNKDYIKIYNGVKSEFNLKPEYEEQILLWLKYKSEKGQSYKKTGLQTLIKTILLNYKTVNELKKSIDHSITNNYSGLFTPNKTQTKTRINHDTDY